MTPVSDIDAEIQCSETRSVICENAKMHILHPRPEDSSRHLAEDAGGAIPRTRIA